jgi:ADP-heptose:LPS heptosyltransferase/GT2 family glycosyltransferase
VPEQPKTIVYLRPDTIGDLILFTPALALFMAEWPKARHVIVIRDGYESLAPLFPQELEWKVVGLNPFRQRPSECRKALAALHAALDALKPDLILAPTVNRTWLEVAVAAHFAKVRSVVLGSGTVDPNFTESLRIDLGVDPAKAFTETVVSDETLDEVESQHRFAEHLIGRTLPRNLPSVDIPKDAHAAAGAVLARHGLKSGAWVAVFPGGGANVSLKSWPTEKFAEVVARLSKKEKMPVLVLGHASEAAVLEQVASLATKFGGATPAIWLGKDGEIPTLGALLKESRFYLGNDTGAMHLAAAVGRPVVGVFGGGTWPRFRPSARQGVSVVQPLPCFGCNWDCHFGDAPCVRTIMVSDVVKAVETLLEAGDKPITAIVESHALPAETIKLIAATAPGISALKRDRVERQHKIEELKAETDSKDVEITSLKAEADAIKAELEQECADKDKEIDELKAETNSKDVEIDELKKAADERKTEMEAIKAELEQECADKDKEIGELKAEATTKDTEIEALKVTCDEREAIVVRLDAGLKAHLAAAAEWERRQSVWQSERAELTAKLDKLAKLPSDPTTWAQVVHDKDVHISNLESFLKTKDTDNRLLEQSLANYAQGYASLELAKHYGQLLTEKEAVVQELHRTCVEREALINELAAESTTVTSRLRKLWIGMEAAFNRRVRKPLENWIFAKVVNDYWMQIGVLKHYEPRPIVWDQRLPRPKISNEALPKIGIVTPSYGQPAFLESTIVSILNQEYPKLLYVVQDGGSKDSSPQIIARYESRLHHWASEQDKGQADAVRKGFSHIEPDLGPDDVMAWFNSDDLIAPRALRYVAAYFAAHPEVDALYGHRIIIDDQDREIGRWIMPRHEADSVEWIDYVPQETLFWRKRAWDLVGGIDPSFQFALDWDLLARFHKAGLKIVRVPYFLGCFRIHAQQKTSQAIHTTGADEMARIRTRFHGSAKDNPAEIERHARRIRFRGALSARLLAAGVRW